MNSKILVCCAVVLCTALPLSLFADNLTQVYQQALTSDPTFKQAQATWLTGKENLTLAETGNGTAGSGLFPNLTASAGIGRTYQRNKVGSSTASGTFDNGDDNYLLTLTQPIFNYATWKQIASARYGVKAATATYLGAAQSLMSRVSSAYFSVLQDSDTLNYDLSSKKAYLQALVTAEQKFKVGLIPVTGVYDAQASYDGAVADEIKDRNAVANDLEDLRAITGKSYQSLNGLRPVIPLVVPSPADINQWVNTADRQNYGIKSSAYTLMSAGEDIKAAAAGRYPTLAAQATWGMTENGTAPSAAPPASGAPAPTGGNSTASTGAAYTRCEDDAIIPIFIHALIYFGAT